MVRLKEVSAAQGTQAEINFNSNMVRLKEPRRINKDMKTHISIPTWCG